MAISMRCVLAATLLLCFITTITGEHIKLTGPSGESMDIIRGKNLSCAICDNRPSTVLQKKIYQQEATITNLEVRVVMLEQQLATLLADSSEQTSTQETTTVPTTETTTATSIMAAAAPRRSKCNKSTRKTTTKTVPAKIKLESNDWMYFCLGHFDRLRATKPHTNTTTVSKYCYYFGASTSFHRASQICKQKGAALAEFPDMKEYELVKTYLERNKAGYRFWIGGHATKEDHTKFIWKSSLTPIANTTWVPTEPTYTYQGKKEKCVSFDGRGRYLNDGGVYYGGPRRYYDTKTFKGFGLNDEFCVGQYLNFICQKAKQFVFPRI